MEETTRGRRNFLRNTLGLLVVSTAGSIPVHGRILPISFKQVNKTQVRATYALRVSDFPTEVIENGIKVGLTEVGSSIKLTSFQELQMNPDHCKRSGRDGKNYPISIVRVKESGPDAFTAVSTWCPHNEKSQLAYFDHQRGNGGLFVCTEHENSCYRADGSWVSPTESPFPDAPDKDEFFFNIDDNGIPHLTRFTVEFDGDDTIVLKDILCDCADCPEPEEG